MHTEDEGARGDAAPRRGAGRGLAYWSSPDGSDQRIIYVTPGYRMIALNAKTGEIVRSFGKDGVVDLKMDNDQEYDLTNAVSGPPQRRRSSLAMSGRSPISRPRVQTHGQPPKDLFAASM
jgi:glucose dehydrogenase